MFLNTPIEPCLDEGLQKVYSRSPMERNGWIIDVDSCEGGWCDHHFGSLCGTSTFWGYKWGYARGKVSAVFHGSGEASLSFGQCYTKGTTKVYLNDVPKGSAGPRQFGVVANFSYNTGDTLMLEEEGWGIIKINYLKLTCGGNQSNKHNV